MTEKELENIISYLEEHHKKETALFGFYHQDGDEYNTCIKANEQGLSLFSSQLLKAILKVRNQKIKKDTVDYVDLELDWTDPNANYFFENIILTKELKTANQQIIPEEKQTWKDQFYGFLIFSSILLLIAMILIGFFTTIKWIF